MMEPPAGLGRITNDSPVPSWAADVGASLRTSRLVARIVTVAAITVAFIEAVALLRMFPLKLQARYTILADRQTGYVEVLVGNASGAWTPTPRNLAAHAEGPIATIPSLPIRIDPQPLTAAGGNPDAPATESNLTRYVIARESFDQADREINIRAVTLWTAGDARQVYRLEARGPFLEGQNPLTPSATVTITINRISFITPSSARVWFEATRHFPGDSTGKVLSYAADVSFAYTSSQRRDGIPEKGPAVFQVTDYKRVVEGLPGITPAMHPLPAL